MVTVVQLVERMVVVHVVVGSSPTGYPFGAVMELVDMPVSKAGDKGHSGFDSQQPYREEVYYVPATSVYSRNPV